MFAQLAPWETFAGMAVTALAAVVAAVAQGRKTRSVNTSEHNANTRKLDRIMDAVEDVADTTRSHSRRLDRIDERIDRITDQQKDEPQ